jgi:hypothetical protein
MRRFSAKPIPPGDEPAGTLLGDILHENLDRRVALEALREWVRRALRSAKLRDTVSDEECDALLRRRARLRIDYRAREHTRKLATAPFISTPEAIGRLATCAPRLHPTTRGTS